MMTKYEFDDYSRGNAGTMKLHIIPNYKEAQKWCDLAKELDAAFEYNEFFQPKILEDEI